MTPSYMRDVLAASPAQLPEVRASSPARRTPRPRPPRRWPPPASPARWPRTAAPAPSSASTWPRPRGVQPRGAARDPGRRRGRHGRDAAPGLALRPGQPGPRHGDRRSAARRDRPPLGRRGAGGDRPGAHGRADVPDAEIRPGPRQGLLARSWWPASPRRSRIWRWRRRLGRDGRCAHRGLRGPAPAAEAARLPHAGLGRRGRGRRAGRLAALDAEPGRASPIPAAWLVRGDHAPVPRPPARRQGASARPTAGPGCRSR